MTPSPDDPRRSEARADDAAALVAFDRDHLWHPYAPAPNPVAPHVVRRARGTRLTLAVDGGGEREVIDAMSSWWAVIHGYSHPTLVDAIRTQVGELSHVMFGGLTHEPAVELARRLVERTPPGLDRVFLSDSGSVAVEVALKMAVQHRRSLGRPEQRRILTWRGGYHGDTLFAMSVCDPDGGMHALWSDVVPEQVFVPMPPPGFDAPVADAYVAELRAAFERHHHEVAAMIVEPVVQGAGGMRFHHPAYLTHLRALCDEFDVLLIFDEIATGFGRTGRWFAAEWAGVVPDILCVGKALTGGMLSLAATLCTDAVAAGISAGEVPVLAHGPTFMGNPLGCAAAIASIDLLDQLDLPTEIGRIEAGLRAGLAGVDQLPQVRDVRVLGAIAVVELEGPVDVVAATEAALAQGVWIRPFGSLIYAMPPFVATDDDLAAITRALAAAARAGG